MCYKVVEKKEIAWKAYPRYSTDMKPNSFKLHEGLYHVNAIEWVGSAMEMSAIGGRNVAILAYKDFLQLRDFVPDKKTSVFSNINNNLHTRMEL